MEEDEPSVNINVGEEVHELNRRTGLLFSFLGELAVYNHIFLLTGEDEETGQATGMYIFNTNSGYQAIRKYMIENRFTAHINLQDVAECDVDAFEKHHYKDVREEASFPESWDATQS